MSIFYLYAAALLLLALAWALWPLLRRAPKIDTPHHEAANLAILKEQLAELENDLQGGILSAEQYAQARAELERRVLDEAIPAEHIALRQSGSKPVAVALALMVIAGSLGLYALLGKPEAMLTQVEPPPEFTPHQVEGMVAQLAQRMEEHPEDAKGWSILARTYYAMGRFKDAAQAYERLAKIETPNADMLADQADALAMAQGRELRGRPTELLQQALKLDPTHWKALMLLGTEAFEREDYRTAINYWERMLEELPPESEFAQQIRAGIEQARAQAQQAGVALAPAPAPAASSHTVQGQVTLAPEFAAQASPEDTVFIFARAASGPKMPLAAMRLKVKQLPASFELGDAQAMTPAARLSQHEAVIVGARISKGNTPTAQAGDLEGYSAVVKPGVRGIEVLIDRRVP